MALDLQHLWAVGDVATASNFNTYLGPPPDLVDINVFPTSISQTNWNTVTQSSSAVMGGTKDSNGAQNDAIAFDIVLAAGTWTFNLLYHKNTSYGIITVQLSPDGSTFINIDQPPYLASGSTIDTYTTAAAFNNRSTLTAITIATTGIYRLQLLMASKNAASSNYTGSIQHIQMQRTA